MFIASVGQGQKESGEFYLKVYAGVDAFLKNEEGSQEIKREIPAYRSIADDEELRKNVLGLLRLKSGDEAVSGLYSVDLVGDTPFNKSRNLMHGPEVDLYTGYGRVSEQLSQAGLSASPEKITAAEDAFKAWLKKVDEKLYLSGSSWNHTP